MKTIKQNVKLPACSKENIARSDDTFSYIDPDFINWKTDVISPKTEEAEVAVLEQAENGTFAQLFASISKDTDSLAMTQAQIVEFCRSHEDLLSKDWYTFFLFKVGDEFFVARVYFDFRGLLGVHAYRLSDDGAWNAGYRRRFVVPSNCVPQSPVSSDSDSLALLESRLEKVERWIANYEEGIRDLSKKIIPM